VGPEIETFLGPEMATSVASAIWAQRSQKSRGGGEVGGEALLRPPPPSGGWPPLPSSAQQVEILEIFWMRNTPLLPSGIGERYSQPYKVYVKQRSCADVSFPYKRKCWTNPFILNNHFFEPPPFHTAVHDGNGFPFI
jgi:hypothetical protein